jgi:hypothetical protein
MDEIALLRSLAPEEESPDDARAEALLALEARFDSASATPAPAAAPGRRRRLLAPRRRLLRRRRQLALAGAAAAAAVVTGVLLASSGSRPETAAAEALRDTASVAAADVNPTAAPGPGQFLYTKTQQFELQSWLPGKFSVGGGTLSQPGAFTALNSWQEEEWENASGQDRSRWAMGSSQFLSAAERHRWERAGAPLPGSFECDRRCFPDSHIVDLRPGLTDVETQESTGLPDLSALPTEPKALRLGLENHRITVPWRQGEPTPKQPMTSGQLIAELWDILDKPDTTPALRAAVFAALAEIPGIELNRNAKDLVGRPGYALSYETGASTAYGENLPGLRVEYIFDPETSAILGRREAIADPGKFSWAKGLPTGTVRREVAYLESGVVDSTRERPAG